MAEVNKKKEAEWEIYEGEVNKIDMVGSPSTGDDFLIFRSSDEEGEAVVVKPKRVSMTSKTYDDIKRAKTSLEQFIDSVEEIEREEETLERQVPPADATNERKRKAQKARSEKYGIEAWENKGENLSYPSGDPTKENLYGDPANLKYPLGRDDNKLDKERAANARARFKGNYNRYGKASQKIIHTRIVEAELKAGSKPAYDKNDPLDKMLPKELIDKMEQPAERSVDGDTNINSEREQEMSEMKDTIGRLTETIERMEEKISVFENLFTKQGQLVTDGGTVPEGDPQVTADAIETATADESQKADATGADIADSASGTDNEGSVSKTVAEADTVPTPAVPITEGPTEAAVVERSFKMVERMMSTVEKVLADQNAINEKMNNIERSIRGGGNSLPQNTTEGKQVERDADPLNWKGALGLRR